jgi:hypothetical protein
MKNGSEIPIGYDNHHDTAPGVPNGGDATGERPSVTPTAWRPSFAALRFRNSKDYTPVRPT